MSFHVAYYFAAFAVILTHSTIVSVNGQCTIEGCENGDPLISIVAEIQQLRVELFDHVNKQVQNIQDLLIASFQQMTRSLQAVDRRPEEHDICSKQVQSIHQLLNETFQEIKSQHGTVVECYQAVDRHLQEHDISTKNQSQNAWKLANDTCGPTAEVCDCSDIKASGQTANGVYEVCAVHQGDRVCTNAFCHMETANVASLVFQRRKDGSVNFNRTWAEYKQGFGNRSGEFWIDFHGNKSFAEYTRVSISSSADNYRLTVSGYSGTAGDSLYYNNGKQFTTNDVDNDDYGGNNCARWLGAGWWYAYCSYAHLNGIYGRYDTTGGEMGFQWFHWHKRWQYELKATEMRLVPVA